MVFSRSLRAAACVSALLCCTRPAGAAQLQVFQNHVPAAVGESRRLGPLASRSRMSLAVGLPLRNRADLDRFLEQLSDRRSPNYRGYLSASEFAERFGPTQADYNKLIDFFQAHGLTVSGTHPNRMILDVSGPVSAIDATLHINMTVWQHQTRGRFFAPDRDPSLDVDVAVLDIAGLDNFVLPKPADLKSSPLAAAQPMTTGSGPGGLFFGDDFRAAYAPGVQLSGAGQTVGLFELDGFFAADVVSNFQQAGLPPVPVSTVLLDGFSGAAGSENIEVILDIMMAGFMAPGASIIVYEGSNWDDVLNRMATDNLAKQLSCSWMFYPIDATTEQIFLEMISQGQSFFTAAGDSGAFVGGIWPPADDPNVTSVGGTALTTTGPGGAWVSETTWNDGGGGISSTYSIPSYQQSMNMAAIGGSSTMRNIPDVAMLAAVQIFLICNDGQWISVGGTSAATPLWAGFMALANQQAATNGSPWVGFLNPTIYAIGAGSDYDTDLHDITTGSNGFAAGPGFDLASGWGTPEGQPLINDLTSMPGAPSFGLSSAPTTVSMPAGSGAVATIQVTPRNGFSAAVALSVTGLPSGVTGTFGAMNSNSSQLTLTASGAAVPGAYTLSIQGISGSITSSTGLNLQVTAAAGFTLQTAPSSLTIAQSGAGGVNISIQPANGFNSAVSLTVSGLPSGVTALFTPASTATASALSFSAAAGAALGAANVTVTGTAGSLVSTAGIVLTVVPPANFSLKSSATALNVTQRASVTATITVTPKAGFSGKVTLAASGLPSGVTASFNPPTTATTSIATFTAASGAVPGAAAVTVTATQGASFVSAALTLTVKAAPGVTLAAAPTTLSITRGTSGSSTITITPVNGFTGAVSLTVSGLPAGVSAAFSPASATSSSKLTLTASSSATIGNATVTINAKSGSVTAAATLALTVAGSASFTLTPSATNVKVSVGSPGSAALTVVPQGGFSGTVAFSAASLPAGVTAAFSPANTATASTLTLTAASSAALKATQFTVKGTSGTLSAVLTLTVTVAAAAPANFSVSLAPASLTVVPGASGAAAVTISGTAPNLVLSATGLPAGVSVAFAAQSGSLSLGTFTAGSSAAAGASRVTVTATSGSVSHTAILNLTIASPASGTVSVNLAPYYNVSGSAVDSLPFSSGGLDAGGRSYSGILLGASQNVAGTEFRLGPMGAPDAVSGQAPALPAGKFTTLKLLATGVNGSQASQTFTVAYTDGSTTTFTQNLSDWCVSQNYAGESQAVTMNYRDNSTGTMDARTLYLYGYAFALNSAKTVSSITLPQNRNVVVLAITLTGGTNAAAKVGRAIVPAAGF
jgi:subtilase family serine protease